MHHTLKLYSRNRPLVLRAYIFFGKWTRIPLIGRVVKWFGNKWGGNMTSAYALTLEEAGAIVDAAHGLALGPCTCRETFHNCDAPLSAELLLAIDHEFAAKRGKEFREVNRDEAKKILQDCHERGLIHAVIKCRGDFYAICNCCRCCCVPLRLKNDYGIGKALMRDKGIVERFRQSA
ncbi:MAG: ferredoxin-like protein [Dehalococcoidia bacterium]|nr:ferredoxin-like protein [Dehalococcoidia bacterium]